MVGIYFILFGTVALSIGYKSVKVHIFNRNLEYVTVKGKVVEQQKNISKRGKKTRVDYTPIFEYYHNGQTYKAKHIISSSKFNKKLEIVPGSRYQIGDEVELRVFKDNPGYAVVNTKGSVNFSLYLGVICTVGGLLLLIGGIYLLFV